MAVYNLSPIFAPQFVATGGAAQLTFAPPGAGLLVPAGYNYQIAVLRVVNLAGAPVSLKLWRVPAGSAADDQHVVCPTINIPVATQTFPYFDVTALWGAVLQPNDCIYALAGAGNALTLQGDGAVITT
jgi:hypothetical protein